MTPKEIFLELLKPDGQPERQLKQYEALHMVLTDPINGYLRGSRVRGSVSKDRWGTTINFPADAPGPMPVTTEELKVCKDIEHWRDYVHAPDIEANCREGWEACIEGAKEKAGNEKLITGFMATGIFEQLHFLMGFEDTLTALYEYPDELHELIDYITEYRMKYVRMLIDRLHPEVIFTHDDWGTKDALFMKPDMWREFFKEPYRRFYGCIRDHGIITVHHADSYLVPIVEDMAEIGIQVWQGALPENDIPALQKKLQGRMVLMGGIGAAIDRPDASKEEIRAYVRQVLAENCPGGHYIPCITYGLAGTVCPHVDPIINEEIDLYNAVLHMPKFFTASVPHRNRNAQKTGKTGNAGAEQQNTEMLSAISEALVKGRRKQVLSLTEQALTAGIKAQTILADGLMPGMAKLGEDFTAGRAFVPEMLVAARCMNAALEILRPLFAAENSTSIGKACLGTVRGDMHDIGKNLVKIMMEGAGIEVVDLGVDVNAETFVQTAIDEHCDIIACSALLTTTMSEMRRVVEIAKERGIRDQVTIMIGGAPITQEFCDEIGADLYTDDAAQAARAARSVLERKAERQA
ncbi:MAG: cobalamin-dependent protein [Solobacterium sp.]|nr:cobalamin-dependent protein [Solobacterium sp.]